MDELIEQFTSQLGLSKEQGQQAVTLVMGFLKDKLPADLVNQIGAAVPDLGGLISGLGEQAGAIAGSATDAAQGAVDAAQAAAGDAADAAKGAADAATGAAGDAASGAKEQAGGLLDSVKGLFNKG